MSQQVYDDGVLRQWWDDDTRTYYEYDETGAETSSRPYTAEENAQADIDAAEQEQAANDSANQLNMEQDLANMQAILDQTNAELRADPSQEMKTMAKAIKRILRDALGQHDVAE